MPSVWGCIAHPVFAIFKSRQAGFPLPVIAQPPPLLQRRRGLTRENIRLCPGPLKSLYVVGVRLSEDNDAVNDPSDSEETGSQQPKYPGSNLPFIKTVCAQVSQEQAEQKRHPFVFLPEHQTGDVGIYVCVGVGVVDHNVRLLRFQLGHLFPALRTHDAILVDLFPAVLAEFCLFLRLGNLSSAIRALFVRCGNLIPAFFTIPNLTHSFFLLFTKSFQKLHGCCTCD